MKPHEGRQIGKMSLLTELEILGAGFLQRCRAYGAADEMNEVGGHKLLERALQSSEQFMNQIKT
jgi:hypothetical protein